MLWIKNGFYRTPVCLAKLSWMGDQLNGVSVDWETIWHKGMSYLLSLNPLIFNNVAHAESVKHFVKKGAKTPYETLSKWSQIKIYSMPSERNYEKENVFATFLCHYLGVTPSVAMSNLPCWAAEGCNPYFKVKLQRISIATVLCVKSIR